MSVTNLKKVYALSGVKNLLPTRALLHFAKALSLEASAGKTTEKAEKHLDLAIRAEEEDKYISYKELIELAWSTIGTEI